MKDNNILLLNSFFDQRKNKLYMVLKDVEKDKKFVKVEENPHVPVYITKNDVEVPNYFKEYRHEDELEKKNVSYRFREWEIARALPEYDSFTDDVRNGNIDKEEIYLDKRVFGGDININDRIIMDYLDNLSYEEDGETVYPDNPPIDNIHLGFFDLEWDVKYSKNNEIFDGSNPIYLMTYVDAKYNECHTYYLYNDDYNRQEEIIDDTSGFVKDLENKLNDYFDNIQGKNSKTTQQIKDNIFSRLGDFKYTVKGFEDEVEMIESFYKMIFHKKKPDFLYAYNGSADIEQTEKRCKRLGIDMKEIFNHPDVDGDYLYFNYWDDTFKPAERRHNYDCASYTKILDMMITYFGIRGFQTFSKYSLEATASREIGVGKLDYSHICDDMLGLPYKDFVVTTQYNIIDVLVMVFIEDMIEDTKTLLSKKFITRTNFDRIFVSTPTVMNTFYHIGERNGKIFSNSINRLLLGLSKREIEYLKEEDRTTYDIIQSILNADSIEGGLCTDPNLVIKEGRQLISKLKNTKLHFSVIDADASSMYPNNIITGNMSKSTLVGKIIGLSGIFPRVVDEFVGDRNILEISANLWNKIKTKKSKMKSFERKYDAIEGVGYKEDYQGNLYIDIEEIFDIYDINLYDLIDISFGDVLDIEDMDEVRPDGIEDEMHVYYFRILQMYLKKLTARVGEMAMAPIIQRDIVGIGDIFYNLPDLEELEWLINGNKPKKSIYNLNNMHIEEKEPVIEKTKDNKELLSLLAKIDRISLSDKDTDTGIYNSNGMFLIDTQPINAMTLHGRYIEYYLESKTPISEFFDLDERVYIDRQGIRYPKIYENQAKPDKTPDINKNSIIYTGEMEDDHIELLRESDLLMRRFEYGGVKLNLTPRVMPILKKLDKIDITVAETTNNEIYDVIFTIEREMVTIEDKFIIDMYMKVVDY